MCIDYSKYYIILFKGDLNIYEFRFLVGNQILEISKDKYVYN